MTKLFVSGIFVYAFHLFIILLAALTNTLRIFSIFRAWNVLVYLSVMTFPRLWCSMAILSGVVKRPLLPFGMGIIILLVKYYQADRSILLLV